MARFFYPYGNAAELSGKSYTVGGGTNGTQPTFTGDPMFYGTYVRIGNLVHFEIDVDFDNITSFGTGQYYLTLPFAAAGEDSFRGGSLEDFSESEEYHMTGHTEAGSSNMTLYFSDKVASGVQDNPFTFENPINLTTADSFHISGTYIAQ
jgi:hypothetical protein